MIDGGDAPMTSYPPVDPSGAAAAAGTSHPLPPLAEGHPLSPGATVGGGGDAGGGNGGGSSAAAALPYQRGRSDLDETEFLNARHDPIGAPPPPPRLRHPGPRVSDGSGLPTSPPAQHAEARAVMAAAAAAGAGAGATLQQQQPRPGSGFFSGLLGLRSAAPSPALGPADAVAASDDPDVEASRAASRLRRRRRRTTAPAGPLPEEAMHDELLTAAAVEFALYSAMRPLLPPADPRAASAAAHAPARRVARTLVCLGRADGLPFGSLALRHMRATALSRRSDLPSLAFWWSNACHLRGFLQSLSLAQQEAGGGDAGAVAPHWAAAAFVPALRAQERALFGEIVEAAWSGALLPAVAARSRASDKRLATATARDKQQRGASAAISGAAPDSAAPPSSSTPPSAAAPPPPPEEGALRRWTDCLDEVLRGPLGNEALGAAGGHAPALRARALLELLRRVDALLVHHLLVGPPPAPAPVPPSRSSLDGGGEYSCAAPRPASAVTAARSNIGGGWRLSLGAAPPAAAGQAADAPPALSPAMLPWSVVVGSSSATAVPRIEDDEDKAKKGGGGLFASLRRSVSPPPRGGRGAAASSSSSSSCLPPLTRATALALLAAADRLHSWALEGPAGPDVAAALEEEGQQLSAAPPPLFALSRGVAALLLASPKAALADPAARRAALTGLPPGVADAAAARFVPDEGDDGQEGAFPADVLLALRREAGGGAPYSPPARILPLRRAAASSPPSTDERALYVPPSDDAVMEAVEAGEEPGLEYGEQSEDELEALERLTAGGGGGGGGGAGAGEGGDDDGDEWWWPGVPLPAGSSVAAQAGTVLRFRLLHNLWSAGVPRSVRPPTADVEE